MDVEVVEHSALKPYHRNPRVNEDTIEVLKESIVKFGFRVPLCVDDNGVIVTGHARYKACLELKGTLGDKIVELRNAGKLKLADNLSVINDGKLFVVRSEDLSHRELQEFRISDNKIPELSKWEGDMLKFELRELDSVVGFDADELSEFVSNDVDVREFKNVDFGKIGDRMDSHFERLSEGKEKTKVSFSCPYCGKGITLDKDYLLKIKPQGYYTGDDSEN